MTRRIRATALIVLLLALTACSTSKSFTQTRTGTPIILAPQPATPTAAVPPTTVPLATAASTAFPSTPTVVATVRATEAPTTAVPASGNQEATEQDNGKSVSLRTGESLTVILHNTYWNLTGSSDPTVLLQIGSAITSPDIGKCLPGVGCGTVTATFKAVGPGKAEVTASRTSCGEALRCSPDQSTFDLIVVINN